MTTNGMYCASPIGQQRCLTMKMLHAPPSAHESSTEAWRGMRDSGLAERQGARLKEEVMPSRLRLRLETSTSLQVTSSLYDNAYQNRKPSIISKCNSGLLYYQYSNSLTLLFVCYFIQYASTMDVEGLLRVNKIRERKT